MLKKKYLSDETGGGGGGGGEECLHSVVCEPTVGGQKGMELWSFRMLSLWQVVAERMALAEVRPARQLGIL